MNSTIGVLIRADAPKTRAVCWQGAAWCAVDPLAPGGPYAGRVPASADQVTLRVAALVLDMDDTINQTDRAMCRGLRQATAALWPQLDEQDRARCIEDYVADRAGWFDRFARGEIDFETMRRGRLVDMAAGLGERIDGERLRHFELIYRRAFAEACAPWPDALGLIDRADAAGIPVAVLSNSAQRMTAMKVRRLGLEGRLAEVLSSDRLGVGKPDPAAYRAMCARLGSAPVLVGYVDDHLRDALGASRAGMQSFWLDRAGRGQAPTDQPAVVSLDQLLLEPAGT